MSTRWILGGMSASLLVAAVVWAADVSSAKCPVSGKAVKEASFVEHNGGKVYFCCDNCPTAFKKNPGKFAAKANHQLLVTGQATEVKCPLTGRDLNTETVIEVAGAKVCFCCNNCKGKASKAEGDAQINLIFGQKSFEKGFKVSSQ